MVSTKWYEGKRLGNVSCATQMWIEGPGSLRRPQLSYDLLHLLTIIFEAGLHLLAVGVKVGPVMGLNS